MNSFKLLRVMVIIVTIVAITAFSMSIKIIEDQINNSYKSINNIVDTEISECYYDCNNQQELAKMKIHQIETKVDKEIQQMITKREAEKKAVAIANEKKKMEQARKQAQKKQTQKQSVQVASVSRGESSKVKSYVYEVTAYTAGYESTGKRKGDKGYGQTASGAYVREGLTLACPPSLPFGTKIDIEGYGVRVCQDRGAHIVEGRLDVYFVNLSDAKEFGRQKLVVKIYPNK